MIAQDFIEPVRSMYAESMKLSPRWAAELRGFWDLDEDFDFDADTPTVEAARSEPGKVTPEQSARDFLESSEVAAVEPRTAAAGRALDEETLGDMLDEKLPRRTVKDIQSGYKDPDRFDKWLAVLQKRVDWDDPIVLPAGEGLNIVRRSSDSQLVIRCDCGHDFCGHEANWKMEAVIHVRDDDESLREIYPKMGHADPDWMELREFICPDCARQLEVEAVAPGYPVVHEFLPDVEGFYRGWLRRELP
ncbi:MAG: acetone carboxylase subunit gamma [Thermoleophilaceae bacterium]